jgi:hypothetical protein
LRPALPAWQYHPSYGYRPARASPDLGGELRSFEEQARSEFKLRTLGPKQLTQVAELAILEEEKKPGFSVSLLQVVDTEAYGVTARLASALYFKNFIKRNWTVSSQLDTS